MLPVVPIVWIAIWAIRAANGRGQGAGAGRGATQVRLRLPDLFMIGAWITLFIAAIVFSEAADADGHTGATLVMVAMLPMALPSLPAAWIRTWKPIHLAFWGLRALGLSSLRAEPIGGATALLLIDRADVSATDLDKMALRFVKVRRAEPMTALAFALLALRRGEEAAGRPLMQLLAALPALRGADPVRRAARLFLQGEAARRGDWEEVERLGYCGSLRGGGNPEAAQALADEVGRRRAGQGPTFLSLRLPRAVYARLAAHTDWPPPPTIGRPEFTLPATVQGRLPRARALLARLEAEPLAHVDQLVQVAAAWDKVIEDPALLAHLQARCAALGAVADPHTLRDRLADPARAALVRILRAQRPPLTAAKARGLLAAALVEARAPLQDEVEDLLHDLARADATPADDWLRLARLREKVDWLYQTGGPSDRRALYHQVFFKTLNHAVHAFNIEKQTVFAFVTMCWLWELAVAQQDEFHIKLMEDNLAIPLG